MQVGYYAVRQKPAQGCRATMLRFEQKELSPEAKRPGQTLRSPESHGLSTELKARLDSNQGMGTVLLNAAWHAQRARARASKLSRAGRDPPTLPICLANVPLPSVSKQCSLYRLRIGHFAAVFCKDVVCCPMRPAQRLEAAQCQ